MLTLYYGVYENFSHQSALIENIDGVSMDFGNWRFNLRASNTEPVVRLNVETRADRGLLAEKTSELLAIIERQ